MLQPKEEKAPPAGGLAVQPVKFAEMKIGRMLFEHGFRPGHWVLHVFMEGGPFPLNFGKKLERSIYLAWPGAKEIKVEWIEEFRSYCVRVFQQECPEGWGVDEVEAMLQEAFGK